MAPISSHPAPLCECMRSPNSLSSIYPHDQVEEESFVAAVAAMFTAEDYPYSGKVLLAALISLSIVIAFVLLLHAYARWLLKRRPVDIRDLPREPPPPPHRRSSATLPGRASETRLSTSVNGLDASVVASLPLFVYGSGPSGEHGEDLECVVCLGAMAAGETGRLLPGCKHAFHDGCIDVWFMSHSTCPICRAEVKVDGSHGAEEGDAVQVAGGEEVVLLLHELAGGNLDEEIIVSGDSGARGVAEVMVSIPLSSAMEDQIIAKGSEPSSSISTTTTTTSCGCSLKRILSRSRSCH